MTDTAAGTLPHVVFVDDEPRILSGLRRMLRGLRDRWDMSFAAGAEEALAILAERRCHVLVSDFRMPGMDGGTLLQTVHDRYPGTARLILSGYTDEQQLLKVILYAHDFINKPCSQEEIVDAVDRALRLRTLIMTDVVRAESADLEHLPAAPSTLRTVTAALADGAMSLGRVADTIRECADDAAELIRIANRWPTGPTPVEDVTGAVTVLGMRTTRSVLLWCDLVRDARREAALPAPHLDRLVRHARRAASLAQHLAGNVAWSDLAFTAGLLREAGQLALARWRPTLAARYLADWEGGGAALVDLESPGGITHPVLGGYVLARWGVDLPAIGCVVEHAPPGAVPRADDLASVVALAHAVAEADAGPVCSARSGATGPAVPPVDPDLRDRIARWRDAYGDDARP